MKRCETQSGTKIVINKVNWGENVWTTNEQKRVQKKMYAKILQKVARVNPSESQAGVRYINGIKQEVPVQKGPGHFSCQSTIRS